MTHVPPDPSASAGASRRTVLRAGTVAAVLSLTSCRGSEAGSGAADGVPVTQSWRWSALPAPPTVPRWNAVTAWTGTEALFLGGSSEPACPWDAHTPCFRDDDPSTAHRDGLAWNPGASTWRRTAAAPQGVLAGPHVVVGDRVVVLAEDALLAYDAGRDTWARLPLPPGHPVNQVPGYSLVAVGSTLVALAPGNAASPGEASPPELPDSTYDLAQGEDGAWAPLPQDPLDRVVFRAGLATPHGLLLLAADVARSGPTDPPPLVQAALLDVASSTWRRLPDSDQLFGGGWTWTGERALDATPGTDSGLDGSYGRPVSYSGAVTLPDGTWSSVPQPPDLGSRGWMVLATAGARVATLGFVYDDTTRAWTRLPAPSADRAAEDPGPAVWTSQGLVVLGSRLVPSMSEEAVTPRRSAWVFHPPG